MVNRRNICRLNKSNKELEYNTINNSYVTIITTHLFLKNLVEVNKKCEMKGTIQKNGQSSRMYSKRLNLLPYSLRTPQSKSHTLQTTPLVKSLPQYQPTHKHTADSKEVKYTN